MPPDRVPRTAAAPETAPPARAPIPSDPEAIEAQIRQRQDRLAETIDELTTRLSPKEIARRSRTSAQQRVEAALRAEDGSLRMERVAAVAAAVVVLLAALVWRRRD